jgi:hypothetical protein
MTETFELQIPTHIEFTLYRFDSIDSQIVSVVRRECTNFSIHESDEHFTIMANDFTQAIIGSKRLSGEIERWRSSPEQEANINSIYFLIDLFDKLPNLEWISFKVSHDKEFSRLVKYQNKEVISFQFTIIEGQFDLPVIFGRVDLDHFNRKCIEMKLMENKYLDRRPYFYMTAEFFIEALVRMEDEGSFKASDLLEEIDPKLEDDNPMLLVKTDYTPY